MDGGKHLEMVRDREAWCPSPWGCEETDVTWGLNNMDCVGFAYVSLGPNTVPGML